MSLPFLASVFWALPVTFGDRRGQGEECGVSNVAHHYIDPTAVHHRPAENHNDVSVKKHRRRYLSPNERQKILSFLSLKLALKNGDSDSEEDADEDDPKNDPKNTKNQKKENNKGQKRELKNLVGRKKIKKKRKVIFFDDQEEKLLHPINRREDLDCPWLP